MFRLILHHIVFLMIVMAMVVPPRAFTEDQHHEFHVRNAATAIRIAKAAFEQEFGKAELEKLKYFEASLKGDHWEVLGHPYERGQIPPHGGSFDFVIAVKGGCILEILAEM